MITDVERNRSTWIVAIKLGLVVSAIAVLVAVAITAAGDVPQAAVVLPVIIVAFTASWIQTGRAGHHAGMARIERLGPSVVDTRDRSTV